ncbi:hypothetical protein GQ43DRAFT_437186 [Delitschia confertaspora ATCC 74209]|uniref:Uncharacterized protein n=1 Tax=Delitschia confertaspora ATCC 74209 TaxID=1513339 RepID=A0A9P4JU84_9PLEO|nr:hypothetical protein GQ43DRAFT_437186 [Delitschia confertaspora ATCC 74209]
MPNPVTSSSTSCIPTRQIWADDMQGVRAANIPKTSNIARSWTEVYVSACNDNYRDD